MTAPQAEPGRPPAEAPIIELRGVTKVYGEGALAFQALNPFDGMEIESGVRLKKMVREAPSYLTTCGLAMRRFLR